MAERMQQALAWIEGRISIRQEDFRREFKAGSDMLLEGAISHGYARQARHGRIGLTDTGRRALYAMEGRREH